MKKFNNYTDYDVMVDGNTVCIKDKSISQVSVNVGILNVQKQLYSFAIRKPEDESMVQNTTLVVPFSDLVMSRVDDTYRVSVIPRDEKSSLVLSSVHSVTITSDKKNRVYLEIMFDVYENEEMDAEPCTAN